MRHCAYCGQPAPQTGEHIFSSCLIKRQPESQLRMHRMPTKFIPPHQTINDVCEECNSQRLGETDAEICRLYDEYFSTLVESEENVKFEYDFNLLSRWLMKSSYNSIRAGRKKYEETRLRNLSEYIIGKGKPEFYFSIFVLLVTPYELKERDIEELSNVDELNFDYLEGEKGRLEPEIMGAKQFGLEEGNLGRTEIYLCLINSYFFFALIHSKNRFQAKAADKEFGQLAPNLNRLSNYPNGCLLSASEYDFIRAADTFGLIHTDG